MIRGMRKIAINQTISSYTNRYWKTKEDIDYNLYLITDSSIANQAGHPLEHVVTRAIKGGCSVVQLREKNLDTTKFVQLAHNIQNICSQFQVPLIINDNVDVAMKIDADGVHVGQEDLCASQVRKMIGPEKILGVTVENVNQIDQAITNGADYVGTSAVFETPTKPGKSIGLERLKELIAYCDKIPLVAVGGVNEKTLQSVLDVGAYAVGVVSAICGAKDPEQAARVMKQMINKKIEEYMKERIAKGLEKIKKEKPLIHHITNFVVMNQTANATLGIGASPIMAHAPEEMEEMASLCNALNLNTGTLTQDWINSMIIAGKTANLKGKPIILDPVGAGATKFRTHMNLMLLKELNISILKGNEAEVGALVGETIQQRGVDSMESLKDPINICKKLNRLRHGMVTAITGKRDHISDGYRTVAIDNESEWLPRITGTGCVSGALIAAFSAIEPDTLVAAASGLGFMGVCAEKAAKQCRGTESFRVALWDQFYNLTPEELKNQIKLVKLE